MKKLMTIILSMLSVVVFSQNQEVNIENGKYFNVNGTLFTGQYAQYKDGIKVAELSVEDGVLSGVAMFYHTNGKMKEVGSYSSGERVGKWYQYNDLGDLSTVAAFKEDKKHGKWIVWDEDGNKRFEMYYDDGNRIGTWKMWDADGNLTTKTFE